MSTLPRILLLSLTLTLSIHARILHASTPSEAGIQFIQYTCKKTSDNQLCVSTLTSDPASLTADLKGLLTIALKAASRHAAKVSSKASELAHRSNDPLLLQCYGDCSENYADAVDQIDDSIAAVDSKNFSNVVAWVGAAIADADSCDAGFKQEPSHTLAIGLETAAFHKLCTIILEMNKMLAGN